MTCERNEKLTASATTGTVRTLQYHRCRFCHCYCRCYDIHCYCCCYYLVATGVATAIAAAIATAVATTIATPWQPATVLLLPLCCYCRCYCCCYCGNYSRCYSRYHCRLQLRKLLLVYTTHCVGSFLFKHFIVGPHLAPDNNQEAHSIHDGH